MRSKVDLQFTSIHKPPASTSSGITDHVLAVTVESFQFSSAEPVAYEWSQGQAVLLETGFLYWHKTDTLGLDLFIVFCFFKPTLDSCIRTAGLYDKEGRAICQTQVFLAVGNYLVSEDF